MLSMIVACRTHKSSQTYTAKTSATISTDSSSMSYIDTTTTVTGAYISLDKLLAVVDTIPIALSEPGAPAVTIVKTAEGIKVAATATIRYKERLVYRHLTDTLRTSDTLYITKTQVPDTLAYKVSTVLVDWRVWLILAALCIFVYLLRKK